MRRAIIAVVAAAVLILAGCKSQTDFITECENANGFVTAKDYTWTQFVMVGKVPTVIVHHGTRFTCHYPNGTTSHFDSEDN